MLNIPKRENWIFLAASIVSSFLMMVPLEAAAKNLPWVGANEYRLVFEVEPQQCQWQTTPVSTEIDLQAVCKDIKLGVSQLNVNSFRVVAYDKQTEPLLHSKSAEADERFYIPYRVRQDIDKMRLVVSWRTNVQDVNCFAIYFSKKGSGIKDAMPTIPLVGDGDFLSFGRRGIIGPVSGGYNCIVEPADVDGDGDTDLFIGFSGTELKGGIYFFENIGTARAPLFKASQRTYPSRLNFRVIDWDGDGLRDHIAVEHLSQANHPSLAVWDRTKPPFTSQGVWLGENSRSRVVFHKNIGSAKNPIFAERRPISANSVPIEIYGTVSITAGDFDGDGDYDLIAGNSFQLLYFENIGTAKSPKLAKAVVLKTQDDKDPFSIYVRPRLADLNGDGNLDILLGNEDGRPTWIVNLGRGRLGIEKFLPQLDPVLDVGCMSVPVARDWDADGDIDLLVGNSAGFVEYFENLSNEPYQFLFKLGTKLRANVKEIRVLAGPAGSIQGPDEAKYGYTMPEVVDWDGDNDFDLLLSDVKGQHYFYENIGTKTNPKLVAGKFFVDWPQNPPKPTWVWWQPNPAELVTHWRCRPAAIDWNKDGLTDYVAIDHEGYLAYYKGFMKNNEKWLTPGRRVFKDQQGAAIRISDFAGGQAGRVRIAIVDWDGDGDLDIIHNAHHLFGPSKAAVKNVSNAGWYENLGPVKNPVFKWRGEIIKKQILWTSEHSTSPEPLDFDGDGKLDLFLGGEDGRITCYHRAFIEDDLPRLKMVKMEKRYD